MKTTLHTALCIAIRLGAVVLAVISSEASPACSMRPGTISPVPRRSTMSTLARYCSGCWV